MNIDRVCLTIGERVKIVINFLILQGDYGHPLIDLLW